MAIDFTKIENEYTRIQNAKADIITAMNKLGANINADSKMDEISVSVESTTTKVDSTNTTATPDKLFLNETAISNNETITGTFTIDEELNTQDDLINQISELITTKANPQGGTDTSDATAVAGDILSGKTAYGKSGKITGTIPTKDATTHTPGTTDQIISGGIYLNGDQIIIGDVNLVPNNIKSGTSIFGVTGNYEGSGGGSSGGGSIETFSGSLSSAIFPDLSAFTIVYTDKNLNIQEVTKPSCPFNFEVVKNSIVFITGGICDAISGCEKLGGGTGSYAYKITSNNFSIVNPM